MTDKQIIDGVDVHWCEHYTGNIGYLTDKNWTCRAKIQGTKCEDWSNCYFKRWQRKEQECEKLKSHINCICFDPSSNNNRCISYNRMAEDYERDLKQLNQLKADRQEALEQLEFVRTFNTVQEAEIRKLSKTLTEIKEIVEIRKDDINDWLAKEILQKINEV